ncbi:hypothetical protein [Sphingobium yanoikuyae]|uniref:hypothetical protein n=1 Tax=Sphingobium yanoikuyae TaxID=13690 RepID=UPI00289ECAF9|nr:hypothetical protein [Sphingobium yanoikuyae]
MAEETADAPGVGELRAQFEALQRQIAAATVGTSESFVALLASPELDAMMAAVTNAAADLDEPTRKRVAAWVKMRAGIATLAALELTRLRGLAAVAQEAPTNGG